MKTRMKVILVMMLTLVLLVFSEVEFLFNVPTSIAPYAESKELSRELEIAIPLEPAPEYILRVNINKATVEELMVLDNIGNSKAQSIIQYRKENGDFKTIEDIMKVKGIGKGIFESIKDYIYVE